MRTTRTLYRRLARVYDPVALLWEGIRRAALRTLPPLPGATVLDLACGTGLSFAPLIERTRAARLLGVDRSGEMLTVARARAGSGSCTVLALGAAESLPLRNASVDLVFCCLAHDVVASDGAMRDAVRVLKPGGRLVLAGVKLSEGRASWLLNALMLVGGKLALAAPLTPRPWRYAASLLDGMAVTELRGGTAFVAAGVKATTGSVPPGAETVDGSGRGRTPVRRD